MQALVADNDFVVRQLLGRYLKRLGCAVAECADGEALLEASRRLKPDLVVSEANMPGKLNGLDACRLIRHERKDAAIVLITGSSGGIAEIPKGEFDLVLNKPFSLDDLRKAVARRIKRAG